MKLLRNLLTIAVALATIAAGVLFALQNKSPVPLDMLVYKTDSLEITHFTHIDVTNAYFNSIHDMWGDKLKEVFSSLPNPIWTETSAEQARLVSLRVGNAIETRPTHTIQTLAGQQ